MLDAPAPCQLITRTKYPLSSRSSRPPAPKVRLSPCAMQCNVSMMIDPIQVAGLPSDNPQLSQLIVFSLCIVVSLSTRPAWKAAGASREDLPVDISHQELVVVVEVPVRPFDVIAKSAIRRGKQLGRVLCQEALPVRSKNVYSQVRIQVILKLRTFMG